MESAKARSRSQRTTAVSQTTGRAVEACRRATQRAASPSGTAASMPSDHGVTAEMARGWALRTCAEQGVPFHISDPATIRRVLVLLGRTGCRDERRHRAG